uniref:Protein osteopotentia-like protein n=2 Tax=Parasteatoda tepidariorum TaxID=114398 RepID=A0A2L2Y6M0_PARTP
MDLQKELLSLVQLMSLMFLFFWSATWNIPPNFDAIATRVVTIRKLEVLYPNGFSEDKHSIVISDMYRVLKKSPSPNTLPPFDAWKEEELTRQEINLDEKKHFSQGRKLNYASAKCGAKILSSNPESSFRMSILNEKIDEYMLNPCHVSTTWFIIELCDTIEATQIELVNYELFSSSPRNFSCYWSDVLYPTQRWRHLGTFEANDERSTQTFHLKEKNLGKFIKVVISSYHGKEHFCVLSVFRVLGYSMIYEFDIDEQYENDPRKSVVYRENEDESEAKYNRSLRLPKDSEEKLTNTRKSIQKDDIAQRSRRSCFYKPIYLFLNSTFNNKREEICLINGNRSFNEKIETMCNSTDYFLQCIIKSSSRRKFVSVIQKSAPAKNASSNKLTNEDKMKSENVVVSAALIQKESVLSKLTHRIKASEMSLSLMNRYLQQLSESYRQQMEDMQIMFNGTMEAISLASEKAAVIDEQLQLSIEKVEQKINSLNEKVEYYGHENLLKQFLELHGFFLILEFIIVSTLFSIFVNDFRRRNDFLFHQRSILNTKHTNT